MKKSIIVLLFVCAVCFTLLAPIRDNDLFWHLATGKWIAEHKMLPETDPFSYTTSLKAQEDFFRAKMILTQYWLANLVQYGIFSFSGFYGIVALRVLIALLTLLTVLVHVRRKGIPALTGLLLLLPLAFVLGNYKGDRPNQMSFLFFALFLFLCDTLKKGGKKGYLLPAVYILWANVHGGFILGGVIAILFIVSEMLRTTFDKEHLLDRKLVFVMALTFIAGFLNPNGYNAVYSMFFEVSKLHAASIGEHKTAFYFTHVGTYFYVWTLGLSLLLLIMYLASRIFPGYSFRRDRIPALFDEFLILVALAALSVSAIRYIPFLVIALLPMAAPLFSGKFQEYVERLSKYFIPEIILAAASVWMIAVSYNVTIFKNKPVSSYYPDDAVQFIKQRDIKGHFFNYYDWGGYLIWEFYPEKFVFIDGRALSLKTALAAEAVTLNAVEKVMDKPLYKAILDSYSVRHILIPAVNYLGDINYILKPLVDDPEWHLIFVGRNSLILTRDRIEPSYPKSLCYALAIANARQVAAFSPNNPLPYLTFAKANVYLGGSANAIKGLEEALQLRPGLRGGSVEKALNLLKAGKEIPVNMH
ncbi:MAG: hypothetical protein FIA94_00060 [Nitrospirae bacterium]|nr:hypothetical protein [Nitrospirota bacterium]